MNERVIDIMNWSIGWNNTISFNIFVDGGAYRIVILTTLGYGISD